MGLQGVTLGSKVTRGYKRLQGVTKGYRGVPIHNYESLFEITLI